MSASDREPATDGRGRRRPRRASRPATGSTTPQATSGSSADDTDAGWGEAPRDERDRWLREQRPPHW